ncbi:MAG TPA: hypothetical protein VGB50_11490 [Flavobacterium sp.]
MKNTFFQSCILLLLLCGSLVSAQESINKLDEKGQKHGLWRGLFDESKRVRYEGTFSHGKETGTFTFYDDTKAHAVIATRDFSKGNDSAYTIFYDQAKNKVSEGNVVNRLPEGKWIYYHKDSKAIMSTEFYKAGKLDGKRTVFYPDGTVAEETNYKTGIKEGAYKKYTDKGVLLEDATYKNGEFHGPAVYKAPDGKVVAKGEFKNGKKNGYWEFFENGKLTSREKYPLTKKTAKATTEK